MNSFDQFSDGGVYGMSQLCNHQFLGYQAHVRKLRCNVIVNEVDGWGGVVIDFCGGPRWYERLSLCRHTRLPFMLQDLAAARQSKGITTKGPPEESLPQCACRTRETASGVRWEVELRRWSQQEYKHVWNIIQSEQRMGDLKGNTKSQDRFMLFVLSQSGSIWCRLVRRIGNGVQLEARLR